MAERVHPQTASPSDNDEVSTPRTPHPPPEKPVLPPPQPPAGTYVIQIPKDQVYRVPPPENADRFKRLSRRKSRSGSCYCCRFFCCSLLLLILLLGIAAGVFYLVFRPESPNYTVESVSIKGLNLTSSSSSSPISPQFDVTIKADNPNNKIGIYYEKGSSVKVYYKDVNLCNGALPQFFQPRNNVTVFNTSLKGFGIELTSSAHNELVAAVKSKTVPFKVNLRVPVKIKVGSVKTWTIKVKVKCDLTVDELTSKSKIVSKDCDYSVKPW